MLPAKRFSYDSFQAVSVGREPAVFFAYCQSQSRLGYAVGAIKHCKQLVAASLRPFKDAAIGSLIG